MAKAPRKTTAPAPAEVAAGPIPPPEVEVQAAAPAPGANKHGVEEAVWADWSEAQRALFVGLFRRMFDNQSLFAHPKAARVTDDQWRTTAWTAAVAAADLIKKD